MKVPLFFWFDLFLEARAEILKKIVGFLVQTMTPKSPFEINWPVYHFNFCQKKLNKVIFEKYFRLRTRSMKHSNTTPRCWRRERLRSWESLTAITPWNRWHLMLTVKKDRKLLTKFTRYIRTCLYNCIQFCSAV